MKKLLLILSLIGFAFSFEAKSQICDPPCTPNLSCNDVDNPGEVCPPELPTAIENQPYSETVTVIPPSTYEGFNIIHSIKIIDVAGLPEGISWCKNEDIFLVTNPPTRYCCQLYGTPTQAGEYHLTLSIVPYIYILGIPVPQSAVTDDSSLVVIVLPPPPVADFTADITTAETMQNVTFQDLSEGNPIEWEWTFEDGTPSISYEQNPVVHWENVGIYDVSLKVYNAGGESTETKENYITVVNTNSISNNVANKIKIYPNPANSEITIEAENIIEIQIVDILGKEVYNSKSKTNKQIIDVSNFNKATYFVKVKTLSGEITKTVSIK